MQYQPKTSELALLVPSIQKFAGYNPEQLLAARMHDHSSHRTCQHKHRSRTEQRPKQFSSFFFFFLLFSSNHAHGCFD